MVNGPDLAIVYQTGKANILTEHDFEVIKGCVKKYLSHARHYKQDIEQIMMRIRSIEGRLDILGIAYDKTKVATSTEGDQIGEALGEIQELREELYDRMERYEMLFQEANDICQPREVCRYALWLHEVEGIDWVYVGQIIGYEERQARRKADEGYREIYSLMPREYQSNSIPDAEI